MAFPDILTTTLLTYTVLSAVVNILGKLIPESLIKSLLFDGEISDVHKTKYFLNQITDRYKESIKGFNRAMAFNLGFAIIALYAYLALPSTGTITIPFISLPVSRIVWISIVPLITYGLQTFIFTSFVWFMILRRGMKLLIVTIGNNEEFGDATNILLDGAIGHIWIIIKIRQYFNSTLNYVWYMPAILIFLVIMVSPFILCIYFIVQLYRADSLLLGIIYSLFFIPFSALFLLLLFTSSLLGVTELRNSTTAQRITVPFEATSQ